MHAWLPVKEGLVLKSGSDIRLFLDVDPLEPLPLTLFRAAYEAEMSPEQVFSYRVVGRFPDKEGLPRIGLRGTAKLYGRETRLFMYLMRRPLSALRQMVGM